MRNAVSNAERNCNAYTESNTNSYCNFQCNTQPKSYPNSDNDTWFNAATTSHTARAANSKTFRTRIANS